MTEQFREELGGQVATDDPTQAFLAALSAQARNGMHRTIAMHAAMMTAVKNGWTPTALASECSRDLGTARNVGGTVYHRLQWCAQHPPTKSDLPKFVQPKPWCGRCDEATRWRLDTDDAVRCDCWTDPGRTP